MIMFSIKVEITPRHSQKQGQIAPYRYQPSRKGFQIYRSDNIRIVQVLKDAFKLVQGIYIIVSISTKTAWMCLSAVVHYAR